MIPIVRTTSSASTAADSDPRAGRRTDAACAAGPRASPSRAMLFLLLLQRRARGDPDPGPDAARGPVPDRDRATRAAACTEVVGLVALARLPPPLHRVHRDPGLRCLGPQTRPAAPGCATVRSGGSRSSPRSWSRRSSSPGAAGRPRPRCQPGRGDRDRDGSRSPSSRPPSIRLVKQGLRQREIWLVGLERRDESGRLTNATNVLVDADTGEVIESPPGGWSTAPRLCRFLTPRGSNPVRFGPWMTSGSTS